MAIISPEKSLQFNDAKKMKKIAYSFLIGDLYHYGHLKVLEVARAHSDYHICGVISDVVVDKWISPKICNYEERSKVIESIKGVDEVVCQDSMDPTENLKMIHQKYPDAVIVLIRNHHLWESMLGSSFIQQINGEIVDHDFYPSLSRENISRAFFRSLMEKRSLKEATFNDLKLGDIDYYRGEFSTKADTLRKLKGLLKNAHIEQEFVFTVDQWKKEEADIINKIIDDFGEQNVVIRSSSLNEDSLYFSNAGYYKSVLNVKPGSAEIKDAVTAVIQSYAAGRHHDGGDQILVQKQTEHVAVSGVVFTRNLWSNTPYYLVNYDEETSSTESVTSGVAGSKVEILRDVEVSSIPEKWRGLIRAIREIEDYFKGVALDIEFAVRQDGQVVIFQVRPLAANSKFYTLDDDQIKEKVKDCQASYLALAEKATFLSDEIFLSDMAFWNPAELIGDRPNYLDYSLFNHLIMKSSWNEALVPLGYTKVDRNLQVLIGGKPYINVHDAFLSLLPESLPENLKGKLLEFYNTKLKSEPQLHDKVEFEIVHNCYHFDFARSELELLENGFTEQEVQVLKGALVDLTNSTLADFASIIDADGKSINDLNKKFQETEQQAKNARGFLGKLELVYRLIEDCGKLGIPPFVRVARLAFMGNALLLSLKNSGVLGQPAIDEFMGSIHTVASEMDADMAELRAGRLEEELYLQKYGHLRPGTYDITRLPYSKRPDYIRTDVVSTDSEAQAPEVQQISAFDEMGVDISKACDSHGLLSEGLALLSFIGKSIELREYFKFIYTKNISLALEIIADT